LYFMHTLDIPLIGLREDTYQRKMTLCKPKFRATNVGQPSRTRAMDLETVRRLNLARHLHELGAASLRSANDMHLFSAVNLLQDAVEAFLIAIADHLGAHIDQNTKFDKYFVAINEKIAPKELPFKSKLLRLNRIRVDSKHYGIQPARDECDRLSIAVREFFDEVSTAVLKASFSTVSAIDLLNDGETKTELLEAKKALEEGRLEDCAIGCRKALFLEVERHFDIYAYKDGKPVGILAGVSDAPYYACSKQYIDENVRDPTDFIVYNHSTLDQKLLTQGADNTAYWNVWRLTPEVYRTKDGKWVVKEEFGKLSKDVLNDKIDYIFAATLDVILSIHRTWQATKWADQGNYYIDLTQETVPVYEKADKGSKVTAHTPPGLTRLDTEYRIEGLNGDGPYWHVSHFGKEFHVWGFVHNDFVK